MRFIGMLVGDLYRQPEMRVKYGAFFQAFAAQFELVDIYDASLRGLDRWLDAAQTFTPDRKKWKERFFKNAAAFDLRSLRAEEYLQKKKDQYDFVLQLGVLFDSSLKDSPSRTIIYTDYTAALSARQPGAGRSPFNQHELSAWLDRETLAYQRAAHIFVRSAFVQTSLINDYQIAPGKITIAGAGVNFSSLPAEHVSHPTASPTFLFIGKDFYRKGGDILLRAFAQVRASIPGARLLLVTRGPVPAGLPLDGVEVISPTWDREKIEALYQQADIFVLPSRLETWGDVLLEAMAYGLPCIGVCGEAMQEIIVDGVTGRLVPPNNEAALTAAMLSLLKDQEIIERYGSAARDRIAQTYTWEHVVKRFSQVLTGFIQPSLL
jgi:glycosyltransferase involved in cell wall biosynthesis